MSGLSVKGFKFLGKVSLGMKAVFFFFFFMQKILFVLYHVKYIEILDSEGSS